MNLVLGDVLCCHSADVYKVGDSVSVEWTYTADSLYFDLTLLDNGEQVGETSFGSLVEEGMQIGKGVLFVLVNESLHARQGLWCIWEYVPHVCDMLPGIQILER